MNKARSKGSVSTFMAALSSGRHTSISKKKAKVYCVDSGFPVNVDKTDEEAALFPATRILLGVWMCVGLVPLLLQARSYIKFVTPHKLTQDLVVPVGTEAEAANLKEVCPVEGLMVAGAWWNVGVTHSYTVPHGRICHFVVPQYNIHGAYQLGTERVPPSHTTPASCSDESYEFQHYFYHGSIGFYAFYEEASGTYCANDQTAYVQVNGLGTYDSNGASLANDTGDTTYRRSYWYGFFGAIWVAYRSILMRRSYISCKRYGRRCDNMQETIRFKDAVVYVQESLRLSAHGARNYHRALLLYLLVEGLMSDLFMLIAQDGFLAKVQYISLGYNLSGVLSMLFEMVESMNWLGENVRCFIKRLLFNYETSMMGELLCAAVMQYYLTSLNRSSLQHSKGAAEAVSHYVWSLVGHGIIVLGIVAAITSVRAAGALITVRWKFGSLKVFTAPCCVDTALGVRSKMILLGGYAWEDDKLRYNIETLKAFGVLSMQEEDGAHFLALSKLHWVSIPREDMVVIGEVHGETVTPCTERPCTGIVSVVGISLGGPA
ncbi:hypothetical protein PHYPSEUDO_011885 [Phytophthora pseudosyringae]|uniref:Uncharacterized protein n=1 Tax=Phytophthora pseudosyringae TaxID=221518 RepID=A0A8T1W435_9STRA|nr:hypothetical protein PHYPSEUDO_011885 [Phytophthora pseudosyringae]